MSVLLVYLNNALGTYERKYEKLLFEKSFTVK